MCEFASVTMKADAIGFFKNHQNNVNLSLPDFKRRFPFAFQPGHCPVCGEYLTKNDMRPAGKATRSMCLADYENLIANDIKDWCFICGNPLPFEKVAKQVKNPREIQYHIEDGECMSLWTVMHNIVLGATDVVAALGASIKRASFIDQISKRLPLYNGKPVRLIT